MASNQAQAASSSGARAPPAQEFKVRVSRPTANKRFSIMKFNASLKVDLAKVGPVIMERENNLKQYKGAYNVDIMPKFGAGSEYGREQKDEARRKKYGIISKRYNPESQPWLMKAGKDKPRNYKGTREGSVSENTSYFIFTQCTDGAFDAFPIEDWYSFNPVINYKFLSSEEAEDAFEKRDKTFNYFNVMLKKRLKNEDEDMEEEDEEGGKKNKGKNKSKKDLMLTELEDWSASEADEDEDSDEDAEKKPKPKEDKKKKTSKFVRKNSKKNDLDEAIEESDEGDYDDKEVDYITDPSSESETETKVNYEDGGVEDEDGLRKINESGGESDDEEKKEEENKEEAKKEEKAKGSASSDSSGNSGDSDSGDESEEDSDITSALFMSNKKVKKSSSNANSASNSRSSTPVNLDDKSGKKRKADRSDSPIPPPKKMAISTEVTPGGSATTSAATVSTDTKPILQSSSAPSLSTMTSPISDGISEENIRRYLQRKPMTTKELLQKFKSKKTGLSNEQLVTTVAQLLKKINPEKKCIQGKMYLSLRK